MPKEFPEIYFSYAWDDPKQGEDSIEYFIDKLYNSLKTDGYPVKRDKMDTGYGDLISDFIREIGEADLIVIGISDKYLRSPYCMWELCEIYRNSALEAKKFIPKLLPIRIEDINFDTQTRRKYIEHWEDRYIEINTFINDHPDSINAEDQKEQQKIRRIRNDFTAIIGQIKDINSLTTALLAENDFEKIKNEINSRTGLKPIKGDDFKNGKIVHNIPPKMQIGLLVRCKIKIAREISHFEQDKDFILSNSSDPENLAISELMKVEIKGDSHAFEIASLTENEMYLELEEATTWLFDIRPLVLGSHKLTLLAYTMKERGKRNSRYYEASIEVVTNSGAQKKDKVIDEDKKEPVVGWISSISLPKEWLDKGEQTDKKVITTNPVVLINIDDNTKNKEIPLVFTNIDNYKLIPINGEWIPNNNIISFIKGDSKETQVGACLAPIKLKGAEIEVEVLFSKLKDKEGKKLDASAKILFNYNSKDHSYYAIGLGGYNSAYSLARFSQEIGGWQAIKDLGSSASLREGQLYKLKACINEKSVDLFVSDVHIFNFNLVLSEELQIGLFAWGSEIIEFRNFRYKPNSSNQNPILNKEPEDQNVKNLPFLSNDQKKLHILNFIKDKGTQQYSVAQLSNHFHDSIESFEVQKIIDEFIYEKVFKKLAVNVAGTWFYQEEQRVVNKINELNKEVKPKSPTDRNYPKKELTTKQLYISYSYDDKERFNLFLKKVNIHKLRNWKFIHIEPLVNDNSLENEIKEALSINDLVLCLISGSYQQAYYNFKNKIDNHKNIDKLFPIAFCECDINIFNKFKIFYYIEKFEKFTFQNTMYSHQGKLYENETLCDRYTKSLIESIKLKL